MFHLDHWPMKGHLLGWELFIFRNRVIFTVLPAVNKKITLLQAILALASIFSKVAFWRLFCALAKRSANWHASWHAWWQMYLVVRFWDMDWHAFWHWENWTCSDISCDILEERHKFGQDSHVTCFLLGMSDTFWPWQLLGQVPGSREPRHKGGQPLERFSHIEIWLTLENLEILSWSHDVSRGESTWSQLDHLWEANLKTHATILWERYPSATATLTFHDAQTGREYGAVLHEIL